MNESLSSNHLTFPTIVTPALHAVCLGVGKGGGGKGGGGGGEGGGGGGF